MADVIEIIQRKAVVEIRGSGPPGPPSSPPTGTGFRHVTAGAEDPTAKLVAASDISDIELAALAGLTSAADKLPYFTGSGTAALADFTAFIRTLLDDADEAAARTTLGAETAGAAAAAQAASQPLDSDLTAIAALATTAYGRGLLVLANATALAAEVDPFFLTPAEGNAAYDAAGAAAAAQAASQPLDSDLTAIAALATTSFGRSLLALADDAAGRTAFALGTAAIANTGTGATNVPTISQADARYQPLDSDLTAIAALSSVAYGRSLLEAANAAALRTLAGLVIGTDVQAQDAELAALAGLTSAADKIPYFTGSGTASVADFTAAGRALVDDVDNSAQRTTLGLAPIASSGSASDLSAGTVPDARMPALTGDVTTSAGAVATTIGTNVVTNAKAAQMAANTLKMNNTGSTANAIDATLAEVLAWLGTDSPLGTLGSRGAPPYFI